MVRDGQEGDEVGTKVLQQDLCRRGGAIASHGLFTAPFAVAQLLSGVIGARFVARLRCGLALDEPRRGAGRPASSLQVHAPETCGSSRASVG